MSPQGADERAARHRFPRVSGDEPRRRPKDDAGIQFSPRERG